jgi:hypothetical protein
MCELNAQKTTKIVQKKKKSDAKLWALKSGAKSGATGSRWING